jgi:hypothetical protein
MLAVHRNSSTPFIAQWIRTRSSIFRTDAFVQMFHLGSNVIPAEMRGSVPSSGFAHGAGENKIGGQQVDG